MTLEADVLTDKRNIGRIEFNSPSLVVIYSTGETLYVKVEDASPKGIGFSFRGYPKGLINQDVIVIADTVIMYATVRHVTERNDGTCSVGVEAKKFTDEVLRYVVKNHAYDF